MAEGRLIPRAKPDNVLEMIAPQMLCNWFPDHEVVERRGKGRLENGKINESKESNHVAC